MARKLKLQEKYYVVQRRALEGEFRILLSNREAFNFREDLHNRLFNSFNYTPFTAKQNHGKRKSFFLLSTLLLNDGYIYSLLEKHAYFNIKISTRYTRVQELTLNIWPCLNLYVISEILPIHRICKYNAL